MGIADALAERYAPLAERVVDFGVRSGVELVPADVTRARTVRATLGGILRTDAAAGALTRIKAVFSPLVERLLAPLRDARGGEGSGGGGDSNGGVGDDGGAAAGNPRAGVARQRGPSFSKEAAEQEAPPGVASGLWSVFKRYSLHLDLDFFNPGALALERGLASCSHANLQP